MTDKPDYDYTKADRQAALRARGRRLNAVLTNPQAIARLDELRAVHGSERAAIEAALTTQPAARVGA